MGLRYQPQSNLQGVVSRTNPIQDDPASRMLAEEARAIERRGVRAAEDYKDMLTKPIDRFTSELDRQQASKLRDRQRELAEEQIASARQTRDLEDKYGGRTREAQIAAFENQSEQARMAANEARERQELLGTIDPETGQSLREMQLRAPIESEQRRLAIAESQAEQAKKTAEFQNRLTQMQMNEIQNAQATRALIGRIQYAKTPEERQQIIDAAIAGDNPTVAYDAISQIKDGELKAKMTQYIMANSDPAYQFKLRKTQEVRGQQETAESAITEIDSIIQELESAAPNSSEAEQAGQQLSDIARAYGFENDAEDLLSSWNFEGSNLLVGQDPVVSRTEKAKQLKRKLSSRVANQLESKYSDIDGVNEWADKMRQAGWTNAQVRKGGNIFMDQNGVRQAPLVQPVSPAEYFGGGQQQQAPQIPQQTQFPWMSGGQQAGTGATNQELINMLKGGRPVNPTVGGR